MTTLDWLTERPIAHRGYHDMNRQVWENTQAAFLRAVEAGFTIECDLQLAADGGRDRLGGSCLAQVYGRTGEVPPDLDAPARLAAYFAAIRALAGSGLLLAYHDRSDGGLAVTLLEMAFAGRAAIDVDLGAVERPVAALYAEELGAVLQVREADAGRVDAEFASGCDGILIGCGKFTHGCERANLQRLHVAKF